MAGQIRLFIGVAATVFADADGSFHGFQWTGRDAFADKNILSIVMEVPGHMLSAEPLIGLWAFVGRRQREQLGSRPRSTETGIRSLERPFVDPNNVENHCNLGQPVDDVAHYLAPLDQVACRQQQPLGRRQRSTTARVDYYPTSFAKTKASNSAIVTVGTMTTHLVLRFTWMSNDKIPQQIDTISTPTC